jgi:predicted MPP superfamily phosphohydrolase
MAFFLIITQAFIFLVHYVLYRVLLSIFVVQSSAVVGALQVILVLLSLSFLAASLLTRRYNSSFTRAFYTLASVWLGILFYFLLASFLYSLTLLIFSNDSYLNAMHTIGMGLLVLAAFSALYGIWNARQIVVTKIPLTLKNLPLTWRDRRVVFVSDVHLGQVHGEKFAERVVEEINKLQPDLVLIGGDLYDGVEVDAERVVRPFAALEAPFGAYFVTGNHESYGNMTAYLEAVESAGINWLSDEKVTIEGVEIIGEDYLTTLSRTDDEAVLRSLDLDPATSTILIRHVPVDLDLAERAGVDLALYGHTHRAQVWPLSYITKRVYKGYDYGLKKFGSMLAYTSSGVGTWGPPLRIGTKPEIVLLEF